MKLIVTPAGVGRSTELIKRSAETGTYIVVSTHSRALMLADMARQMGLPIPFPITWNEVYMMKRNADFSRLKSVYVDDIDDLLNTIFSGVRVELATMQAPKAFSISLSDGLREE